MPDREVTGRRSARRGPPFGLPIDTTLRPTTTGRSSSEIGFDEVQVLARELRSVLERAVPATVDSFRPPTGEQQAAGAGASLSVADAEQLLRRFAGAATGRNDPWLLALFGWPLGPDTDASLERLSTQALRMRDGFRRTSDTDRLLAELFPQTPMLLPGFAVTDVHHDLGRTRQLASPGEIDRWMAAMGRVRDEVGRLTTASMLSTMLGGAGLDLAVTQDVIEPGERWAALTAPPDEAGGRACLCVALLEGWTPAVGDAVVGLVIDGWSERIPKSEQIGGLAFHHDAPNNRPPQSWLLAVPDGERWNAAAIADMILDTFAWAQRRVVATEDLGEWGHALPMSVLPATVSHWPSAQVDEGGGA